MEWTGGIETYQLCSLVPTQRVKVPKGGVHQGIPQKSWALKGIHDPNALQHFAGYNYCPWCRKDRQNDRTIINHLRTVHYRLGLICNQCFCCPTVMSDTLC